ncbi:hypothetical protein FQN57_005620 [Myotisia sp. PD_48]|nr:hypothetical protein FQN57_005620 [Myotisia sp. PD_48]
MRLLIIGGNGRTGRLVIAAALKKGYTVTALIRNPDTLEPAAGLKIIKGTPLSLDDVKTAIESTPADPVKAIIVTLNAPRVSDNPYSASIAPPRLMADSHLNLATAMRMHGITKIVTMSAFGVGDSFPYMHILLRLVIRTSSMAYQFEDHGLVDEEIKAANVDYVLVRPVMLTNGPAMPIVERGPLGDKGVGLLSKITKESVAQFLIDAAVKNDWNKKTIVITN